MAEKQAKKPKNKEISIVQSVHCTTCTTHKSPYATWPPTGVQPGDYYMGIVNPDDHWKILSKLKNWLPSVCSLPPDRRQGHWSARPVKIPGSGSMARSAGIDVTPQERCNEKKYSMADLN